PRRVRGRDRFGAIPRSADPDEHVVDDDVPGTKDATPDPALLTARVVLREPNMALDHAPARLRLLALEGSARAVPREGERKLARRAFCELEVRIERRRVERNVMNRRAVARPADVCLRDDALARSGHAYGVDRVRHGHALHYRS